MTRKFTLALTAVALAASLPATAALAATKTGHAAPMPDRQIVAMSSMTSADRHLAANTQAATDRLDWLTAQTVNGGGN